MLINVDMDVIEYPHWNRVKRKQANPFMASRQACTRQGQGEERPAIRRGGQARLPAQGVIDQPLRFIGAPSFFQFTFFISNQPPSRTIRMLKSRPISQMLPTRNSASVSFVNSIKNRPLNKSTRK